jgi:hypothetical protein
MSCAGVDTGGGTWGISFLDYIDMKLVGSMHLQIDNKSALHMLETILKTYYSDYGLVTRRYAGVEKFETGQSAGARGGAADVTRQGVFRAVELFQLHGYYVRTRKAADVKPKITDKLLKAAGILQPPEMRHANDGSRQALFAGITDAYLPNPLR